MDLREREVKVARQRVDGRQAAVVGIVLALAFVVIYFDMIVLGYVVAVVTLSAFFVVVAFDIGVPRRSLAAAPAESSTDSPEESPVASTGTRVA